MALPSTQKEVTTRRIASLISELWKKIKNAFLLKTSRGAASGVASLDANGKVPTSQLPTVPTGNLPSNSSSSAGIVASGSGQQNKVWRTDSNGNPAWRDESPSLLNVQRKKIYNLAGWYHIYSIDLSNVGSTAYFGVAYTFDVYADAYQTRFGYVGRVTIGLSNYGSFSARLPSIINVGWVIKCKSESVDYTFNLRLVKYSNHIELYAYHAIDFDYMNSIVPVHHDYSYNPGFTDDLKVTRKFSDGDFNTYISDKTAEDVGSLNYMLYSKPTGSTSVPVYVNSNGTIDTCTVGSSNGLASLDANGKVPTSQLPALYTYQGTTVSSVSALINAIKSEKVAFGSLQFANAAQFGNIYIYNNTWYNYQWVSTAGNESWGVLDLFVGSGINESTRPCIRFIYDGGKLRNPMYLPCSSGSVGDNGKPVFVDSKGELKACTGGSLINYEVTSAVPQSPTAGKFYFIS